MRLDVSDEGHGRVNDSALALTVRSRPALPTMLAIYYALRRLTVPVYKIKGIGLGRLCEFIRPSRCPVCARRAPSHR